MASWNRGKSASRQWLLDRVDYESDDCLLWPFATARGGYGNFACMGERHYAHRYMCELTHGPAPSDTHEASHECGKSNCVNPRHLSWKTPTENHLDCRLHGTHVKHRSGNAGKVTRDQAAEIRSLKGVKTLKEIGQQFGLSESGVSNIWCGRRHNRPSKIRHWAPEEDDQIRRGIALGMNFPEIAGLFSDRNPQAVAMRAYRIGLKSGQPSGSGDGK